MDDYYFKVVYKKHYSLRISVIKTLLKKVSRCRYRTYKASIELKIFGTMYVLMGKH